MIMAKISVQLFALGIFRPDLLENLERNTFTFKLRDKLSRFNSIITQ